MRGGIRQGPIWGLGAIAICVIGLIFWPLGQPQLSENGGEEHKVAFLGDSFTGGSDMDSGEASRWPTLISTMLGWEPEIYAEGGSGFAQPGRDGGTFADHLPDVIEEHPNFVIIAGGLNDLPLLLDDPHAVYEAASKLVQEVRAKLPTATVVVFSPFDHGSPRQALRELGRHLGTIAALAEAEFVDVLDVLADDASLIGDDGVHPTDAGHRAIARYVLRQPPFADA